MPDGRCRRDGLVDGEGSEPSTTVGMVDNAGAAIFLLQQGSAVGGQRRT